MNINGMTVKQAAEYLGLSCQSVYDYIWAGRIKYERFGSAYVLDEASVKALERRPAHRPKKSA